MIGSYKKWGTEGHIEKPYEKRYKKHKKKKQANEKRKKQCVYKDVNGQCVLTGYVNHGLSCKRPGECHHFNGINTTYEASNLHTASTAVKPNKSMYKGENLFSVGTTVRHVKFGEGIVKEVSNGRIIVSFPDGDKILGLEMCLSKKLLAIEE